jgi:hypothetical protein
MAMVLFLAEETKPGTVEKKPKHMKSNKCHSGQRDDYNFNY